MRASANGRRPGGILFIYKKSAYQIYVRERKSQRFSELLERGDASVDGLVEADRAHRTTIEEAQAACRELGVKGVFRYRSDDGLVEGFDLVVTLGGDGTLLWASHRIPPSVPVLAINSAPMHSVGHFCGGKKGEVVDNLADALAGRLSETRLTRMLVALDGDVLHRRVLNDALFCHRSPAATTRYTIEVDQRKERQKSSGVWVGPAAGSTAAQRSAGGRVLPPASRRLQYLVREPYQPKGSSYHIRRGLIGADENVVIRSEIREGRVYLDGPHVIYEAGIGSQLLFRRSPEFLSLLAFPRAEQA